MCIRDRSSGAIHGGIKVWQWSGIEKTLIALVGSPVLGFIGGVLLITIVSWLSFRMRPTTGKHVFRVLQLLSLIHISEPTRPY